MTDPIDPPRRRLYRARDESIWALIRQRYLSGETQKTLALAYDVPICTIQKRISREGWSKRAAIGVRPTFGGMAAARDFEIVPPSARWPEAYAAPPPMAPMPPAPLSPDEAAEEAAAAAGRAVAEGRYDEAQKLARLSESLRRLAPGRDRRGGRADEKAWEEPEDLEDAEGDRSPKCTGERCAMKAIGEFLLARLGELGDELGGDGEDLSDWVAMAEAMGAADPELSRIDAILNAEGMNAVRESLGELIGVREAIRLTRPCDLDR